MDIFDKFHFDDSVDLTSLVQEEARPLTLPTASLRNRAATLALLNPEAENMEQSYNTMIAEGQIGDSTAVKTVQEDLAKRQEKSGLQGLMSVLADPTLSFEEKKKAVAGYKNNPLVLDSSNELFANSLSKPVKNESVSSENARLSAAEIFGPIYESRKNIQGLVNAHAASLQDRSYGRLAAEMLELSAVPYQMNVQTGNVATTLAQKEGQALTWWPKLKSYLLAGSTKADIIKNIESLPPGQKEEKIRALVASIQESGELLFSDDNQFAQFMTISELVHGNYGSLDKGLDNLAPLLDTLGLGYSVKSVQAARAAKQLKKAVEAAEAGKVADTAVQAPVAAPNPLAEARKEKQRKAVAAIEKQWAFDPAKPMPDEMVGPAKPADGVPTLLGGTGRKVVEEEPKKQVAALFQRIELNNNVRAENPASPAKIMQQANPDQARAVHAAVLNSPTDEAAEALYGTNKAEAIASDILPQATVGNGAVMTKPSNIQMNLRKIIDMPRRLVDFLASTGASEFSAIERVSGYSHIQRDFREVAGLTINDSMSAFKADGGNVKVLGVYGPGEGAWSNAQEAFDQAKVALRGLATEDEIVVLQKQGLDHVPVNLADVKGVEGNYLIRLETDVPLDVTKIDDWEGYTTRFNWADRIPGLVWNNSGSLTRNLIDVGSFLDPKLTGPAAAATYKTSALEKLLLELAGEFGDKFQALDKATQAKVNAYIVEANQKRIPLNEVTLRAQGWKDAEMDAIKSFRSFWDSTYFLENRDLALTLKAQGFELFVGPGDTFVVKQTAKNRELGSEIVNNRTVGGTPMYNPASSDYTSLTKAEIDDLYAKGGYVGRFKRPIEVNGKQLEYIIVRNTPNEYSRVIKDSDMLLNYIPGYYTIQYNAPKFIDEILEVDSAGNPTKWKTIAVAKDTLEAETFKKRMVSTTGKTDKDFRVRNDDRALTKDSESWWDINSQSGRIAQRRRGKLLEEAVGPVQLGDGSHILSPVDSATRAARSIAGRVVTRPVLEAAKTRFVKQFSQFLQKDKFGEYHFPSKVGDIGATGNYTSKEIADARSNWEYINYLENGYINGIDDTFKAVVNGMADMLGKLSTKYDSKLIAGVERGLSNIGEVNGGPVSLTKNFVFHAYIGTNVLRQLIVQPHQVIRTHAYNPVGWMSGSVPKYLGAYLGQIVGKRPKDPDLADFVDFVQNTGILANVDKQNLVRGVLTDLSTSSNRFTRGAGKVLNAPRRAGFDVGELGNMLGHAAAVYDMFKRRGKNVKDKTVREEMVSEMSAISYGMNFAEDLPYNQTSAAVILQFMQVPHKAFLQVTNRRIPAGARARMLLGDLILWGGPAYLVSEMLGGDVLPDNPEARELLVYGLESMVVNALFRGISGDDTRIDITSLAPYDYTGFMKVFDAMMSGGVEQLVLASPAANLLFKDGSKLDVALSTLARWTGASAEPFAEDPTTIMEVAKSVADISSGFSNAFKAHALLETRKRLNAQGVTVNDDVTYTEALMQMFGFGDLETKELYALQQKVYKDDKAVEDDFRKLFKEHRTILYQKLGKSATDNEALLRMNQFIYSLMAVNPKMAGIIQSELRKDYMGKDQALVQQILASSGFVSPDDIRRMPGLSEEERKQISQILEDQAKSIKEFEEAAKKERN